MYRSKYRVFSIYLSVYQPINKSNISKVDLDIKYSWTKNGKFMDLERLPGVFLEDRRKGRKN